MTKQTLFLCTKNKRRVCIFVPKIATYGKELRAYNSTAEKYKSTHNERDLETGYDFRNARSSSADVVRFNTTDPMESKYPSLSTYGYVGGNPVRFVDPEGADTWFYSESGDFLQYVPDNNANGVSVISNNNLGNFNSAMMMISGKNRNGITAFAREQYGITYLTDGLLDFAQNCNHGNASATYEGNTITSMKHNGKETKGFFVEYGMTLGLTEKGEVTVTGKPYTSGAFNSVDPQSSPIGNAHLHPMPGDYDITVKTNDPLQPLQTLYKEDHAGPSKDDRRIERQTKNVYHNVVLDPINMYLYRGETHTLDKYGHTVTIPVSNITIPLSQIR